MTKEQRGQCGTLDQNMFVQVVPKRSMWPKCREGQRNNVLHDTVVEGCFNINLYPDMNINLYTDGGQTARGGVRR